MAYVVTEPCINCKHTVCVENCPVICFHEGANFLVISPDDCIDCGACVDPCPVNAIFPESDVPEKWQEYIALNARLAREWPEITQPKAAMAEAETYAEMAEKRALLDESPGEGDPA